MKGILSQIEIGSRIAELRKIKGLSQVDLAKRMDVSRPSLSQIELGNRSVDIIEFQKLSVILEFSFDDFMSKDFSASLAADKKVAKKIKREEERISVPTLQLNKFKNVLLYILERCAGKPNVGETVLYKLLYFSDFNHYEVYEEHLTGAQYRKLPFGPVPQKLDMIINQMVVEKQIQKVKTEYHGFAQTRFLPLEKADLTELKASEVEIIDAVIEQMGDWSANVISDYSHGDKPWKASKDGEEINYELAFYRRPPYSIRAYKEDEQD
jgi:transcriptional regulator with XRE-family HTH domain